MSPRPREPSDEEIVAAAARAMQRYGPTQLTLAHVAREAGVVPATLIQRFGTKRGLLLAVSSTAPAGRSQERAATRPTTSHLFPGQRGAPPPPAHIASAQNAACC